MPSPSPEMQTKLNQSRLAVERYKGFGKDLEAVTAGWKKGDVFDPAKTEAFKAVCRRWRVELVVTSHLGVVTEVAARLEKLEISVWSPPPVK